MDPYCKRRFSGLIFSGPSTRTGIELSLGHLGDLFFGPPAIHWDVTLDPVIGLINVSVERWNKIKTVPWNLHDIKSRDEKEDVQRLLPSWSNRLRSKAWYRQTKGSTAWIGTEIIPFEATLVTPVGLSLGNQLILGWIPFKKLLSPRKGFQHTVPASSSWRSEDQERIRCQSLGIDLCPEEANDEVQEM